MRIPLPEVSRQPDGRAHAFPFQIAMQTHEFLQGTLFHASFADIAAGEFVRLPDGVARIEAIMSNQGTQPEALRQGWHALQKYQAIFGGMVFQSVLIALNSHWDWYVRRLVEFIRFGRQSCGGPSLSKQDVHDLERADRAPLRRQIELIERAAGVNIELHEVERDELVEMALVRNLGLHNRWEVDRLYCDASRHKEFAEGDLRLVDPKELHRWHLLLIKLLNSSSLEVAKRFEAAPVFGN